MVIKSKSKTRAKQRKGAVCNWKHVGKVTLRELKKRGMTGEQMRRLMWGRASISTPTRVPTKKKMGGMGGLGGLGDLAGDLGAAVDPFGGGAGGGGLMAALDVMAFSNDMEAPTDGVHPTSTVTSNRNDLSAGGEGQDPFIEISDDPLRQMVLLCSKYGHHPTDEQQQELLALAKAASLNDSAEVIPPRICTTGWLSGFGFMDYSRPSISAEALDQPPDLAALDPSDSDGLGEGPLLGRGARLKRAKSAKSVKMETSSPPSDERNLLQEDSSSTHSEDLGILNPSFTAESRSRFGSAVKRPQSSKTEKKEIRGRPRPKTARTNRVAPLEAGPPRRPATTGSAEVPPPPPSPPDPLDAWSTKDITNMNALLAWEDQEDSI